MSSSPARDADSIRSASRSPSINLKRLFRRSSRANWKSPSPSPVASPEPPARLRPHTPQAAEAKATETSLATSPGAPQVPQPDSQQTPSSPAGNGKVYANGDHATEADTPTPAPAGSTGGEAPAAHGARPGPGAQLPQEEAASMNDEASRPSDTPEAKSDKTDGVRYLPFVYPSLRESHWPRTPEECHAAAELTGEQQKKYDAVLAHCERLTEVRVARHSTVTKPIEARERMWMTRECILRYLRATKWHVANAQSRIESTLTWRREFGTWDLAQEDIAVENETGKQIQLGFDRFARPCLYLLPSRQNTSPSRRQIQNLVFFLEVCVAVMPPGVEMLALLVDFKSSTSSKNPSVGQAREVLHILQNHYCERLGRACVINVPFFVWTFFKLIQPFIDPVTREKLKFNEFMPNHVPPEQLVTEFGGECRFEYDYDRMFPATVAFAQQRLREMQERWVTLEGSRVGASEWILRGGADFWKRADVPAEANVYKLDPQAVKATGEDRHPLHEMLVSDVVSETCTFFTATEVPMCD